MGCSHGRRTTINEARSGESRPKGFRETERATYGAVSPATAEALLAAVVSARVAVDVSLLVVDEVDSSGVGERGSHDGIAESGCMLVNGDVFGREREQKSWAYKDKAGRDDGREEDDEERGGDDLRRLYARWIGARAEDRTTISLTPVCSFSSGLDVRYSLYLRACRRRQWTGRRVAFSVCSALYTRRRARLS